MSKLASSKRTRDLIEKYGFRLTKSLGQNFLVDQNILDKIVDAAQITKEDVL